MWVVAEPEGQGWTHRHPPGHVGCAGRQVSGAPTPSRVACSAHACEDRGLRADVKDTAGSALAFEFMNFKAIIIRDFMGE